MLRLARVLPWPALLLWPVWAAAAGGAWAPYDSLLSREATGAAALVGEHADQDGRGVVIAVLDTGVDGTVPGLRAADGAPRRLLAARDFSGEGDVALSLARLERQPGDQVRLIAASVTLTAKATAVAGAVDDEIWIGTLEEHRFAGTRTPDANGNGRRDDTFHFVALRDRDVPGQAGWRVLVDVHGDGVVDDVVVRPFEVRGDVLTLVAPGASPDTPPLPLSLHVRPSGPTLEVHMPSGAHGTHVAGIAAGARTMGREGFDGVAPGAALLSLKIGHNALSGGASTTEAKRGALAYAARWSRLHDVPVVANISYGIGSETEGRHEIEAYVDDLLVRHPKLTVVISGGNEGPGLSTIGTPAGARLAITAAAGYTPAQTGPLLGRERAKGDVRPFYFSSRGGELAKPDLLAPGIAWAAVPDYEGAPIKAGTSMAAPLTSGLAALLWSRAVARGDADKIHHGDVKAALLATARRVDEEAFATQGAGVPRVDKAARWLDERAADGRRRPLALAVAIDDRRRPDQPGSALFWRLAAAPDPRDPLTLRVQAILPGWWGAEERARYFSRLRLVDTPRWLEVSRGDAALRGEGPATFTLRLLPDRLPKGAGLVEAVARIRSDDGLAAAVPLGWIRAHGAPGGEPLLDEAVAPAAVARRFLQVADGQTDLEITVEASAREANATGRFYLYLYDPDGRPYEPYTATLDLPTRRRASLPVPAAALVGGLWEVDVYGHHRNAAPVRVRVLARGSSATPVVVEDATRDGDGPLEVTLALRSRGAEARWLQAAGEIGGVLQDDSVTAPGDRLQWDFVTLAAGREASLRLELDASTWARVTDVAVRIFGPDGGAPVRSGAMGQRVERFRFTPKVVGDHRVEMIFGLTREDDRPVSADYELRLPFGAPLPLQLAQGGLDVPLYPGVARELLFRTTGPPPAPGYINLLYGEIRLTDRPSGAVWHRVQLRVPAQ